MTPTHESWPNLLVRNNSSKKPKIEITKGDGDIRRREEKRLKHQEPTTTLFVIGKESTKLQNQNIQVKCIAASHYLLRRCLMIRFADFITTHLNFTHTSMIISTHPITLTHAPYFHLLGFDPTRTNGDSIVSAFSDIAIAIKVFIRKNFCFVKFER